MVVVVGGGGGLVCWESAELVELGFGEKVCVRVTRRARGARARSRTRPGAGSYKGPLALVVVLVLGVPGRPRLFGF